MHTRKAAVTVAATGAAAALLLGVTGCWPAPTPANHVPGYHVECTRTNHDPVSQKLGTGCHWVKNR